jgi:hypothetical protein
MGEVELLWSGFTDTDLQYRREVQQFVRFLLQRVRDGAIRNDFVEEVLEYEVAASDLRFLQKLGAESLLVHSTREGGTASVHVHLLSRVVRFRHDPALVLRFLGGGEHPPILPAGEYWFS